MVPEAERLPGLPVASGPASAEGGNRLLDQCDGIGACEASDAWLASSVIVFFALMRSLPVGRMLSDRVCKTGRQRWPIYEPP
ncbi:hypothetical protein B0E45_08700 [Sinorhizobium sp. A49]|nr:hypothetical protein B0E45_08700 [Sinorhizobium sp. A49]